MTPLDIEVSETINGVCVSLRVAWTPEALSAAGVEAETLERLAALLAHAMRRALPQALVEADRNLLQAWSEVLCEELVEVEVPA